MWYESSLLHGNIPLNELGRYVVRGHPPDEVLGVLLGVVEGSNTYTSWNVLGLGSECILSVVSQ